MQPFISQLSKKKHNYMVYSEAKYELIYGNSLAYAYDMSI